jgi:hypothetical protein
MKYAIYKGDIYSVIEASGRLVGLEGNNETAYVMSQEVIIIPDDIFKEYQEEYQTARTEMQSLISRMHRLNTEYQNKKEALQALFMSARQQEISIINRIINRCK